MILKKTIHLSDLDMVEKLQALIGRLKIAKKENQDAYVALLTGDKSALRELGFSEEHIVGLKSEDFVRSVRNINSNIRYTRKLIAELKGVREQRRANTVSAVPDYTPRRPPKAENDGQLLMAGQS